MISTIQHSWLCHCGFRSRHRSSGCSLMPPIGHRKWFVTRLWNCQKESNSFSSSLNHTCTQKTDGGWKAVKRLLFSVYLHRFWLWLQQRAQLFASEMLSLLDSVPPAKTSCCVFHDSNNTSFHFAALILPLMQFYSSSKHSFKVAVSGKPGIDFLV